MTLEIIRTKSNDMVKTEDGIRKFSFTQDGRALLEREAENLMALHPISPELLGVGDDRDGKFFIEMEYIEGQTLEQCGQIAPFEIIEFATSLALSLQMLHNEGYVHRDVKPSNVMVTEDDVRLIDFGAAEEIEKTNDKNDIVIYSTTAYTPPEILLRAENWCERSDVFSFGATVYFAATGKRCFQGVLQKDIINQILNPEQIRFTSPVSVFVNNCLQRNPIDRYQDFSEVLDDLALLASGGKVKDRTPAVSLVQQRIRESKSFAERWGRSIATASTLGLILIVCVLTFLVWPTRYRQLTVLAAQRKVPIRFEAEKGFSKLELISKKSKYELKNGDIAEIDSGHYLARFKNPKSGDTIETVRFVPPLRKYELGDDEKKEPSGRVKVVSPVFSYRDQLKHRKLFGISQVKQVQVVEKLFNKKSPYYLSVGLLEGAGYRLPTLVELRGMGKSPADYHCIETPSGNAAKKVIGVPQDGKAVESFIREYLVVGD